MIITLITMIFCITVNFLLAKRNDEEFERSKPKNKILLKNGKCHHYHYHHHYGATSCKGIGLASEIRQ